MKINDTSLRIDLLGGDQSIEANALGSAKFCADYGIKYAYLAGAMYKGIASKGMVIAMGRSGLLGFFGAGGLDLSQIESAIRDIQAALNSGESYGMNFLCNPAHPELESRVADIYIKYRIPYIEAAAFMQMTPALVKCRLKGVRQSVDGKIQTARRILAKVSRPEVAEQFMRPAPHELLARLVISGELTESEARLGSMIPMADDICVEADSGGHTDQGVAYSLLPAMQRLRDEVADKFAYPNSIRIGAAGGIGVPAAVAASFVMGADFILTGSINQCTVEAGTSDSAKDMLQLINVQDTTYAPAGDMFEIGAKVQVLKRGVFFPARANKLHELYTRFNSIEEIDEKTIEQIEKRYFGRKIKEVWEEVILHYSKNHVEKLEEISSNPKRRMAAIFKWYFMHSSRSALVGSEENRVDYQIHCGPALGAFNQWVKGSEWESWRNRYVAKIGEHLMERAASTLSQYFGKLNDIRRLN